MTDCGANEDPVTSERYGSNTRAAVDNFHVSGQPVDRRLIAALAQIKAAAAMANARLGVKGVDDETARVIVLAADRVIAGELWDQFPIDYLQTGSGTSTNMNVNEVLSSVAGELAGVEIHPNDQVNASQSTNDTFPTAIRIAATGAVKGQLVPALKRLTDELDEQSRAFADVVKPGRTHLMDATPVFMGDEFAGYAAQIREAIERLEGSIPRLVRLPLGGTATGNGLNTPAGFARAAREELEARVGFELAAPLHHFAVQGSQDVLVELSAQLRGAAVAIHKIANDIRLMGSGPETGLGELEVADLQPGSSIMPGKTNPVICEVAIQACAQVIGNDAAVAFAGARGELELNVFLPLMAQKLLESIDLVAGSAESLADKCINRLEANRARCRSLAERSPAVATALNLAIGYDRAAEVVKASRVSGRSLLDEVVARGLLSDAEARAVLDVDAMASGALRPRS